MSGRVHLTDDVLSTVLDAHSYVGAFKAEDFVAAIRELRDRAAAVVGSASFWADMDGKNVEVDVSFETFEALREALPPQERA